LHIHNRDWPVFWLAFILVCSCLPVQCTVAFEQSRQAYSSGGCAGLARDCISRVTGFPFHPPADKQEDTIHVAGGFYIDCLFVSMRDDGHIGMQKNVFNSPKVHAFAQDPPFAGKSGHMHGKLY